MQKKKTSKQSDITKTDPVGSKRSENKDEPTG